MKRPQLVQLTEAKRRLLMNRLLMLVLYSTIRENLELKKEIEHLNAYIKYLEGFKEGTEKRTNC